jgi:hypothetical protein
MTSEIGTQTRRMAAIVGYIFGYRIAEAWKKEVQTNCI